MSRIANCYERCESEGKTALIPYITAGDGGAEHTLMTLQALANNGADIIELGMPFSDPMADGPVIQKACERSIAAGMTLTGVLELVTQFRDQDKTTPIVLMGYMNPIERFGRQAFAEAAQTAGVDGVLLVDCPPEEAKDFRALLVAHEIDQIFLIAPTSTEQRLESICGLASGFVYYVSLKGVTGAATLEQVELSEPIANLRSHTELPIAVGFGIKTPQDAVLVAGHADAVVIGSALVEFLHESTDPVQAVNQFLSPIRAALDSHTTA